MLNQLLTSLSFAAGITLPSIFLLLFGLFLRRIGQIDGHFCHRASQLMFNWALPALLFFSIVDSRADPVQHWRLLLAGTAATLLLFTAAECLARRFIREPRNHGVFVQGVYRGNNAIIGLAFCANAYGHEGIVLGAIFASVMTLLFNILAVITLSRGMAAGRQIKTGTMLWNMLKNPLIIAIVLGLVFSRFSLTLPETVAQSGRYLGNIALPLALICVGATFEVKTLIHWKNLATATAWIRLVFAPLAAVAAGMLFALDKTSFGVLFLMSVTPVAAAAYVMTKSMGSNDVMAANLIGITTFLSMFTASAWIALAYASGWM